MANDVEKKVKIEDLPKATELADTDLFPIVQGAEGHRITRAVEASLIKAASGASALTELSDVTISSPTDGQVIKYDSSSDKWVNADDEGSSQAGDVEYSNVQSHLDATNVQDAIDEVVAKMSSGSSIIKSATLTAGASSVSITDNIISEYGTLPSSGETSCLSFFVYTDMPGLAPYSKTISGHTLTLKFVPQLTDVHVYVAFQMCAL